MWCNKCGTEIVDKKSQFCSSCGNEILGQVSNDKSSANAQTNEIGGDVVNTGALTSTKEKRPWYFRNGVIAVALLFGGFFPGLILIAMRKPRSMRKTIATIIIAAIFVWILVALGNSTVNTTNQTSTDISTPTSVAKNPNKTSGNKLACDMFYQAYVDHQSVLSEWVDNAATDLEASNALGKMGSSMQDAALMGDHDIPQALTNAGAYLKRSRIAVLNNDSGSFKTNWTAAKKAIEAANSICASIK
jgi:hypothetical protein